MKILNPIVKLPLTLSIILMGLSFTTNLAKSDEKASDKKQLRQNLSPSFDPFKGSIDKQTHKFPAFSDTKPGQYDGPKQPITIPGVM